MTQTPVDVTIYSQIIKGKFCTVLSDQADGIPFPHRTAYERTSFGNTRLWIAMIRGLTAFLLAIELFATTFIQIPIHLVKRGQQRSSYSDAIFSDLPGDSDNEDLSVTWLGTAAPSEEVLAVLAQASAVLCEDTILISNQTQLCAIGTDAPVTDADRTEGDFGTGEPLCFADGTPAVYRADASYYIVNDIPLPAGGLLPAAAPATRRSQQKTQGARPSGGPLRDPGRVPSGSPRGNARKRRLSTAASSRKRSGIGPGPLYPRPS